MITVEGTMGIVSLEILKNLGYTDNFPTRFAAKTRSDPSGCILWTAATNEVNGYGVVRKNGTGPHSYNAKAHRAAWELAYGAIPEGLMVCHRCDVKSCVNVGQNGGPSHLFLGTNADNCNDRNAKGRQARGETHPNHKLTEDQVRQIRALKANETISCQKIADKYSVSATTINQVVRGANWRHVV